MAKWLKNKTILGGWLGGRVGGWLAGLSGNIAISAFNWVEVEVEAELGNTSLAAHGLLAHSGRSWKTVCDWGIFISVLGKFDRILNILINIQGFSSIVFRMIKRTWYKISEIVFTSIYIFRFSSLQCFVLALKCFVFVG